MFSRLHSKLNSKYGAYSAWHKNPLHRYAHWAVLLLAILILTPAIFLSYRQLEAMPKIFAFETRNAYGEVVGGQILFLDEKSDEILGGGLSNKLTASVSASVQGKKYKLKFTPTSGLLTSLEYDDVELDKKPKEEGSANPNLGDSVGISLDEPPTPPGWDKVLAIGDVKGFKFSRGRYKKIAQGKDLFKCLEWDFANQKCDGRWKKIAKLAPGVEYTVEFAPGDPGYAESSKKVNVLNKKKELLDYVETTLAENKTTVTLAPAASQGGNTAPAPEIIVSQIDMASPNNDLILDAVDTANDDVALDALFIDTTLLAAAETKITATAESPSKLLNCVKYDETANICQRWKKEKDLAALESYDMIVSSSGKSIYGQSRDGLLVLDKNHEVLSGAKQTDASKVATQLVDMNPYKITTYFDSVNTAGEIIVDVSGQATEENNNGKTMSFDLRSLGATGADIDAVAVGHDLFKCDDFNLESQVCNGKYKKIKDLVKDDSYTFSLEKQENNISEFFESKKQIAVLDKDDQLFDYTENIFGTDVEITPTDPVIIKKIKVKNHIENTDNDLKIDEVVPSPRDDALQAFAVNPVNLAAPAEIDVEAKGNELYKCKDWNFTDQACLGEWVKIQDIEPGSVYTLNVGQADPGFMEIFTQTPASASEPAPEPTPEPAPEPTPEPASEPTPEPAPEPTPEPAPAPAPEPQITTSQTTSSSPSSGSTSSSSSSESTTTTTTTSPTKSLFSKFLSFFGIGSSSPTIIDEETLANSDSATSISSTLATPEITNVLKETAVPSVPALFDADTTKINTSDALNETQAKSIAEINNISSLASLNHGLSFGYISEEIKALQKFFNAIGITVAKTGPGSPGFETRKFGLNTLGAVKRFQIKYGVVKSPQQIGFGYIGPGTRAKIKEILKRP